MKLSSIFSNVSDCVQKAIPFSWHSEKWQNQHYWSSPNTGPDGYQYDDMGLHQKHNLHNFLKNLGGAWP